MTRNFSNQRRDGMPPSSRNSAPGRYSREEQSTRPARPRLSRDAVDRAWENGATRTYADYRPRQNSSSPTQRQGRPAPAYERSRQPQNRRPYSASQQDTYQTPRQGNYQSRQQSEDRPRHANQPGYRAPGGQPGLGSERWTRPSSPRPAGGYTERHEDQRPPRFRQDGPTPYRGSNRPPRFQQDTPNTYRDSNRPPRFQQQDTPNTYRDSNRPPRSQQETSGRPYRGPQQAHSFEQTDRREPFTRGTGGNPPPARRDSYNPRWQSRPGTQREYTQQQRDFTPRYDDHTNERPGRAQFEGDYERFNDYDRAQTGDQTPAARPAAPYTRPVTQHPNGRVLKGSRPSQRKQARFWDGVENETSTLLEHGSAPQEAEIAEPQEKVSRPARPKKPGESRVRKVKMVKTARADGVKSQTAKVARKNARGPQKPVTRPSQRGYQWPTAGE